MNFRQRLCHLNKIVKGSTALDFSSAATLLLGYVGIVGKFFVCHIHPILSKVKLKQTCFPFPFHPLKPSFNHVVVNLRIFVAMIYVYLGMCIFPKWYTLLLYDIGNSESSSGNSSSTASIHLARIYLPCWGFGDIFYIYKFYFL